MCQKIELMSIFYCTVQYANRANARFRLRKIKAWKADDRVDVSRRCVCPHHGTMKRRSAHLNAKVDDGGDEYTVNSPRNQGTISKRVNFIFDKKL